MKRLIRLAVLSFIFLGIGLYRHYAPTVIDARPESEVEMTRVVDGVTYKLDSRGDLYRVKSNGRWVLKERLVEFEKMEKAFQLDEGIRYRVDLDDGRRFPTVRTMKEGFEKLPWGAAGIRHLMGPSRGWGSLTLQSPKAPTVKASVALQGRVLNGEDFLDASVAPDASLAKSGLLSLKCVAPAKAASMVTCKSSLTSPVLYFREGDDFWFRASYFASGARPTAVMDLECPWLTQGGGLRVMIDEAGFVMAELNALEKPKFRQLEGARVPFPMDQWVDLVVHFHLAAIADGVIQIWQDGNLLVDTKGQTLPFARVIYSSLEIGLSAHNDGASSATLWVDDVEVAEAPFADGGG